MTTMAPSALSRRNPPNRKPKTKTPTPKNGWEFFFCPLRAAQMVTGPGRGLIVFAFGQLILHNAKGFAKALVVYDFPLPQKADGFNDLGICGQP